MMMTTNQVVKLIAQYDDHVSLADSVLSPPGHPMS